MIWYLFLFRLRLGFAVPLTFPSHVAAILPFRHIQLFRRIPLFALVVGSISPDLVYLLRTQGRASHEPLGLLTHCLPMGLVAFAIFEFVASTLVLAITAANKTDESVRASELGGPKYFGNWEQGNGKNWDWKRWGWIALGVLVGAITHQLWDGFTHDWMWPARVLYPDSHVVVWGHSVLVVKLAQHISSVLGALIVVVYVLNYWGRIKRTTALLDKEILPTVDRQRLVRMVLGLLVFPLMSAMATAAVKYNANDSIWGRVVWDLAWSATTAFLASFVAIVLVLRIWIWRGRKPKHRVESDAGLITRGPCEDKNAFVASGIKPLDVSTLRKLAFGWCCDAGCQKRSPKPQWTSKNKLVRQYSLVTTKRPTYSST